MTTLGRAADLTMSVPDKRRYLFRAAVLAYELGQADVGDAYRAVLALLADDEHTRLLLEELGEMADVGAGGGVARIQVLIGLAERSRRLGDERLAESFLRSAAYRCWMREPGNAVAATIARLVTERADSLGEPQRAIMLAYADPVGSSSTVTKIMHAVVTTDLDLVTVYTLGHAGSCIGDFAALQGAHGQRRPEFPKRCGGLASVPRSGQPRTAASDKPGTRRECAVNQSLAAMPAEAKKVGGAAGS